MPLLQGEKSECASATTSLLSTQEKIETFETVGTEIWSVTFFLASYTPCASPATLRERVIRLNGRTLDGSVSNDVSLGEAAIAGWKATGACVHSAPFRSLESAADVFQFVARDILEETDESKTFVVPIHAFHSFI